jgi:hypothetical protein
MFKQADFIEALDINLLRALIAIERMTPEKLRQSKVSEQQLSEMLVKTLTLIYVCLRLRPDYFETSEKKSVSAKSSTTSSREASKLSY